jgi:hypothetical protein
MCFIITVTYMGKAVCPPVASPIGKQIKYCCAQVLAYGNAHYNGGELLRCVTVAHVVLVHSVLVRIQAKELQRKARMKPWYPATAGSCAVQKKFRAFAKLNSHAKPVKERMAIPNNIMDKCRDLP